MHEDGPHGNFLVRAVDLDRALPEGLVVLAEAKIVPGKKRLEIGDLLEPHLIHIEEVGLRAQRHIPKCGDAFLLQGVADSGTERKINEIGTGWDEHGSPFISLRNNTIISAYSG